MNSVSQLQNILGWHFNNNNFKAIFCLTFFVFFLNPKVTSGKVKACIQLKQNENPFEIIKLLLWIVLFEEEKLKRSGASLHHKADFGRVGEYMKQEEPAAVPHKNQVHYPQRTYQMKENTTYIWSQKSYCLWKEKHSPSTHTHFLF